MAAVIYSLWIVQRVFHGPNREGWRFADLTPRETAIAAALIAVALWLGLYPAPLLRTAGPALQQALPHEPEASPPETQLAESQAQGSDRPPHVRR